MATVRLLYPMTVKPYLRPKLAHKSYTIGPVMEQLAVCYTLFLCHAIGSLASGGTVLGL